MTDRIQVAIPIFDGLTALDAVGPLEVLQRVPTIDIVFCAPEPGPVDTDNAMLRLVADEALASVIAPDVVIVPGGIGTRQVMTDSAYLDWLREVHAQTRFTTSVCSGALVLAAAGLLPGLTATTHWSVRRELARLGAEPVDERVVEHERERIITAAGVSAGIDMALTLVAKLVDDTAAQAAQLLIEYDPQPPFSSGSLTSAPDEGRERALAYGVARD